MSGLNKRVMKVIARTMNRGVSTIQLRHRPVEDLGIESLDYVELVLALEQEFDVVIDDDFAQSIPSVRALIHYLELLTQRKTDTA